MDGFINLSEIPAHVLAQALIQKLYHEHAQPKAMNPDGSLLLTSISSDDVRRIAHQLIDQQLKKWKKFKDDQPPTEEDDPSP